MPIPPWQFAFMDGAANEIYGFCLDSRFAGLKFSEIVQRCFKVGTSDAKCIVHPPRASTTSYTMSHGFRV